MKKLFTPFLLALLFTGALLSCRGAATATVTFNPSSPGGDEYFVEEKQPDGTFKEVVKGAASPLVYQIPVTRPGSYVETIRVKARWLATATLPATVSPPSAEASANFTVSATAPTTVAIVVTP